MKIKKTGTPQKICCLYCGLAIYDTDNIFDSGIGYDDQIEVICEVDDEANESIANISVGCGKKYTIECNVEVFFEIWKGEES